MTVFSFRSQQASDYLNFNVHNVLLKAATPIGSHSSMNAFTYYFVTCELLSAAAVSLMHLPRFVCRTKEMIRGISGGRNDCIFKGRRTAGAI